MRYENSLPKLIHLDDVCNALGGIGRRRAESMSRQGLLPPIVRLPRGTHGGATPMMHEDAARRAIDDLLAGGPSIGGHSDGEAA